MRSSFFQSIKYSFFAKIYFIDLNGIFARQPITGSRQKIDWGKAKQPPQAWAWLIWFAATIFVLYQLALQNGYGAFEDQAQTSLQMTSLENAILSASFLIIYSILQIPSGLLLDRFSVRWLLTLSAILFALSTWAFGAATNYTEALIARSLLGAFSAVAFPAAGALSRRWINPAYFALAMGLIDFSMGVGAVIGDLGFDLLLRDMSWQELMNWMSLVGFVIGVLCWLVVRDRPPGSVEEGFKIKLGGALTTILSNRKIWYCCIYYGGVLGTAYGFGGLWDIELQKSFGFSHEEAVELNTWIFIGIAISAPLSGALAGRVRWRQPILLIGTIGAIIFVSAILFIPMPFPHALTAAMLLVTGLMLGTSIVIFPIACDLVSSRYSATVIGLVNMIGCLMGGFLQFLPGWMLGDNHSDAPVVYQKVLSIFLVVLAFSMLATMLLRDNKRSD